MRYLMVVCLLVTTSIASLQTGSADDIVSTAVSAGKFKTLAAALEAADLVKTLSGSGPFTVFAPTDKAFAKLPAGTVENLLKPENKAALTGVLTYHVVAGKVTAAQVVELSGAKTVNGQRVDIKVNDGKVTVDGAKVVATDIECDNGVIHIIDSVILPADKSLVETADAAGVFKTLIAAAKVAGLAPALSGDDALTVFAPTDEAFAKLPAGTVESLLKLENKQKLVDLLKYHVVPGRVYSEDAFVAKTAKTLAGLPVSITVTDVGAMVNDSKLLTTDVDASNGVIHIIDAVMIPPAKHGAMQAKIEHAVMQGAKLYNAGHHAECAKVYRDSIHDLMSLSPGESMHDQLTSVMEHAEAQHCPTQRAWTLRHGLDSVYTQLVQQN